MERKTKFLLIGLGVVAVGAGAYFFTQFRRKNNEEAAREFENVVKSGALPASSGAGASATPVVPRSTTTSGFPLKKGSKGTLVRNLQNALIKRYGASILPKYGADGDFGSETQNALISKGYNTLVDEDTFTRIVVGSGSSSTSDDIESEDTSAKKTASTLHLAILGGNFSKALSALKTIGSVSEYKEVSNYFQQIRVGLVRKTVVTALLDAFDGSSEKKALNQQFYRMGLKYDGSKWSLSGIYGNPSQLVTTTRAKVWDQAGRTILVPKGTILGQYLDASGGVTEFETIDGRRLFVSTQSIHYTP